MVSGLQRQLERHTYVSCIRAKVLGHACQPLSLLLVLAMMHWLTVRSAGAVPVPGILHGR